MQLGFGGEGTFLSSNGFEATTASSNTQVALASGLHLPLGLTLDARTQRLAARNWLRRPDGTETVVDGDLVTLPDIGLHGTLRPDFLKPILNGITASARLVATEQHSRLPSDAGIAPDVRTGRTLSYPLSASFMWNEAGSLTTGAAVASTYRVDSLPGSRTETWSHDIGGDLTRTFKLPAEWEMKSNLRARLAYQHTFTSSWVETSGATTLRSRLADNGREAINFNADTDVAQNVTFSLQGSRTVTYDNNLNRRITQLVFSTVLQISFFAGELR
jgi:hypothetical protein